MKRGPLILPVLWLGACLTGHAFTLDIASTEVMEFGQGPRSILVPGYGEVTFESGLDGALVLDSAYASTDRIEVPISSEASVAAPSIDSAATDRNPELVKIANRLSAAPIPIRQAPPLQPADGSIESPSGGWNAVPEATSAALGLIGMLMLLLRRHNKTMLAWAGRP